MTYEQIDDMIGSVGLPYAYDHFDKDDVNRPAGPPFIAFLYPQNNDPAFDDRNYVQIEQLQIELYTDNKDFGLEATVESTLSSYGMVWTRDEEWIESERMLEVVYEMDVVITPANTEVQNG